jgi:hypothetical protein
MNRQQNPIIYETRRENMKKTESITIGLLASVLLFTTNLAIAIEPIPEESGFSGFVNVGVVYLSVKSNMVAGNDLGDVGERTIDSIFDSPDSENDVLPLLNAELRYTFASTRTQLFMGNLLEDYLRLDLATQAGLRQELQDASILGLSYVFNSIPTEVWVDPYVARWRRQKTDRTSSGLRLTYDKILGSDLQVEFTWRKIDVDDEFSGRTFLGLPEVQAERLDREGDQFQLEFLYAFKFGEKHSLVPSFEYARFDLDGDAMSHHRYRVALTHGYRVDRFSFVTNLLYAYAGYDKRNPIYNKTQEDHRYGGSLSAFYHRLFNVEKLSLMGAIFGYKDDANIDFYEASALGGSLSLFFRF